MPAVTHDAGQVSLLYDVRFVTLAEARTSHELWSSLGNTVGVGLNQPMMIDSS